MDKYASAIEKIVELSKPVVVKANGEEYILKGYSRATTPTDEYINLINEQEVEKAKLAFYGGEVFKGFTTLSSLCDIIKAEINCEAAAFPYFICVDEYNAVDVYGSYETNYSRRHLYQSISDNKHFDFGTLSLERAIITIQSKYTNNEGADYVIDLCSRVSNNSDVTSEDNGVSQKVQTTKGIALKKNEMVKNRVMLQPFRTFMEIEQPESEYLLRLGENPSGDVTVSLIESDGGAWKLKAKASIAEFLKANLTELITEGKVIVLQ
jgi:hypothetical protein